ncbi:hypothetical protein VTP01DRAFT_9939 [Rhizomucor pusillus]|uniref:uncharacterized protein n=1 Tax=Rhizomucor pusillus TaxID=4840 RepID=UPI0037434386
MLPRLVRSTVPRLGLANRAMYTTGASMSEGEQHIYNKLSEALSPHKLRVVDVSGGCGSMYAIDIASKAFEGASIVKQHRLVNEILKEEIKGMHGLQLKTSAK